MLRKILSVVVGYVVIVLLVMLTFSAAYLVMGTERAFQPGSFDVSFLWILNSIVLGLIAAVVGGWVCAKIAKDVRVPLLLAALVLVLGIAMAIPTLTASGPEDAGTRTGDLENFEAMQRAHQPPWVAFLNPILGAGGVMLGARLRRSPATEA